MSDVFDKNQRHRKNKECVTSKILQRALLIKEFKHNFKQSGKPSTILKAWKNIMINK
jgi:hypothetical protein